MGLVRGIEGLGIRMVGMGLKIDSKSFVGVLESYGNKLEIYNKFTILALLLFFFLIIKGNLVFSHI